MAKLRPRAGHEVARILLTHGFSEVHQRGSHLKMEGVVNGKRVVVTVPQHRVVKPGTLRSIIRDSGIPRSEFE